MNKIIAVSGGFYFFGKEIKAPDGYIGMTEGAMFGSFSGGKGLPGVARGDAEAKVTLDRFAPEHQLLWPITAVVGIFDTIDLYTFKGTTLR